MKILITIILILSFNYIATSQTVTRRAIEKSAAIPPGGNPTPPTASYIFALSDGITISWTASTDADGIRAYQIFVNSVYNISIQSPTLKYTVDGLTQNTSYNITVMAVDNVGNVSAFSNIITHRTLIIHGPQTFNSNQEVYNEFVANGGAGTPAAPIIDGYEFAGPAPSQNGNVLRFFGCSALTIRNCVVRNSTGGPVSACRGIYIDGGINHSIRNNLFWNTRGGMLISSTNGGTVIEDNQFLNMPGPYSAGQMIAFTYNSGAGNIIQNNRGINWYGESISEDIVSLYSSDGTALSKTLVQDNLFQGDGPSRSGGGIVCGEDGGSNVRIQRNKLLTPGNYAVAITGGDGDELLNNDSYQSQKPWSNNGVLAYGTCSNVTVTGNRAHAICGQVGPCNGQAAFCSTPGASNNCYIPSDCSGTKQACPVPEITLVQLAFPTPQELITFLGEDKYWKFRENKDFMSHIITYALQQDCVPQANIERPNAVVLANFSTGSTSTTLTNTSTAAAGNTIASYLWEQVAGPIGATIVSPTSSTTSVTGLSQNGVYIFRLVISQNNYPSQASLGVLTYDSDRVIVTKT